jgi:hypothetical protein
MKTSKTNYKISSDINSDRLDVSIIGIANSFSLPIWLAIAVTVSIGFVTKPVRAENTGSEDIQHYMQPQGVESTSGKVKKPSEHASSEATGLSDKKASTEKCKGADKITSGGQKINSEETQGSSENVGQETKESSSAIVKESNRQVLTPGSQAPNIGQNTKQMPLAMDQKAENSISSNQNSQVDKKIDPVSKPADGKGKLPTFAQADVNKDHYITKDKLQNFPYLLQVFDKVDAGKDGKLEQHEFENLEMETKREGEVR